MITSLEKHKGEILQIAAAGACGVNQSAVPAMHSLKLASPAVILMYAPTDAHMCEAA
jgi:hypothetical protein